VRSLVPATMRRYILDHKPQARHNKD